MKMVSRFDLPNRIRRVAAGYQRNRLAALQIIGGAVAILIATAAQPSTGQAPSSGSGSLPEKRTPVLLVAGTDEGTYGSTQRPTDKGLRLERFAQRGLFHILGKEIRGASGEDMGRIVDVLFDQTGRPRAAVIDFGGFLGVGTRKIAIDWNTLRFDAADRKQSIIADLDGDQIKAAPEYKNTREIVAIVTEPGSGASNPGW
jgi:PRC-barrel domain